MRILFIVPYPFGEAPSQRFRFEQYFTILRDHGITFQHQSFWSHSTWRRLYQRGHYLSKTWGLIRGFLRRWLVVFHAHNYDYLFIHRECAPIGPPVFEWILAIILKKKIIFDFDDAIWLPNTSQENSFASFLKWHSKTSSICKWSYRVSCGNAFLADYASQFNNNVVINPTTINTEKLHNPELYQVEKDPSVTTIGWTGTHSTLQYLDFLGPIINELNNKFAIRFVVISNTKPSVKIDCLEFVPWNQKTEIQDLMQFDIGVMPLTDDKWSKGKCGFKALQYMSLGIPTVASPVGVNTTIIDNGVNGILCNSSEEWIRAISELIEDSDLRKKIGQAGISKVQEKYSVKSNMKNFLHLFNLS